MAYGKTEQEAKANACAIAIHEDDVENTTAEC
jgi:hypothetical protein